MFQYGHGKSLQSKTLSLENFLKSFMIFEPHNNMQVANKYLFSQLWSTSETVESLRKSCMVLLGNCLLSAEAVPCCLRFLAWCVLVSSPGKE